MTTGQIVDLIITLVFGALLGMIGYLFKGRLDTQDRLLGKLTADTESNRVSIAGIVEAQKAVVQNQLTQSRSMERLIGEWEDLEDVTNQLQDATRNLRERMDVHKELHERMQRDNFRL